MLDTLIRGAEVVDGTGSPAARADVGITGGRIVVVGSTDEPAHRTIDATGLVVTPGFIDSHTHHDAQLRWDGAGGPTPQQGITSVIGGNCGFSIAPLVPDAADYVRRMLARVEGMPLESLEQGVDWAWEGFGQYLDGLEGSIAVNAGFLAGHSTMRRVVMGEAAVGEVATPDQTDAMVALLDASIAGGALGFSTSLGISHFDGDGNPVPSRFAEPAEMLALARATGGHDGTCLAINPGAGPFPDELLDLMSGMAQTADRPLNWNALLVNADREAEIEGELASSDHAAARGATVVAQAIVDPRRFYMSLLNGFLFDALPGWATLFALPVPERVRVLADPEERRHLDQASSDPSVAEIVRRHLQWGDMRIVQGYSPTTQSIEGRYLGDVARERGVDPFDLLCDLAIADDLRTVVMPRPVGDDDASWALRARVWTDPRAVVGASDSGAHLDVASSFTYTTSLLGEAVRERQLLSLEQAVHEITEAPRRIVGLTDRGRVAEGWIADLVVLDPATIGPTTVHMVDDLPGGARRLVAGADGIHHVLVRGVEVVTDGELTGARPGVVLRSGRDTDHRTTLRRGPAPTR